MKIVIINKSDATGGAAVVSRRLMEALREAGHDARMLVAEKLTDSPYIALAAGKWSLKRAFLMERLGIFLANGLNRRTLFKIDTCGDGVALWRHPWVREADVVCLNWVNQGLLSLKGIARIHAMGKKIVWTMHDMWNMTGICHHADGCTGYCDGSECRRCPLLGSRAWDKRVAYRTLRRKRRLYEKVRPQFVAVSHWLEESGRRSTLLADMPLTTIPNAFPIGRDAINRVPDDSVQSGEPPVKILFGAARLDDPVKGWPILAEVTRQLSARAAECGRPLQLITFGNIRDERLLDDIAIPHKHLGHIAGADKLRALYESCDIVVSTSHWETLPGTLVEGQAYGCIPVAFDRGGQRDIVDHLQTGYLAPWSDDLRTAASAIADGILWAAAQGPALRNAMLTSAARFSYPRIAAAYVQLVIQVSQII